ncbi:hypothetical protein LCGC14_0071030 [marine sediment metagenome]|uniref:Uncharacterized protein n=1 Tax=marine sediment metagenome TaxID=412755 RepID=A0A0F9VPU8_9ZZZZ|nr:hypothetical protein [Maribacter sp.]HDZ05455.1 hypothetical protein [Maribacter sp.]HEA80352.1 hypothetical protein [Maribacter sp.]
MINLIGGISILIGSVFISLLIRDYIINTGFDDFENEEEDAFCEIDMEHVLMYSDTSKRKDIGELKRKLQDFKNRNKFYKM